jgi:glycine cleavage system H protein
MINTQPYEDGWFYKLQPSDSVELDDLMTSDSYYEFINSED